MPYVNVLVKNPDTGEEDRSASEFLVDTGATVSIINGRYEAFIGKLKPYDSFKLQYVNGMEKHCALYKIIVIIKGHEFKLTAAYDEGCPFLLLGHFEFLEQNSYTIFDSLSKQLRIVRM